MVALYLLNGGGGANLMIYQHIIYTPNISQKYHQRWREHRAMCCLHCWHGLHCDSRMDGTDRRTYHTPLILWQPLSDETKKFHRDRYQDFFWDQNFRDQDWDFLSRPNISETNNETFLWDQMFSRLIPRLFSRPNVFETDTETFWDQIFWDRYQDFFLDQIFWDQD